MNILQVALLFFISLLMLFSQSLPTALAQTPATQKSQATDGSASLGVAHMLRVKDTKTKDASIVSVSKDGGVASTVPYDSQVLGVVARDAAIIINSSGIKDGLPIISNGTVYVLVSSKAGNIKKGDLLTTSTMPGVAVLAVKAGYVLGSALEDYNNSDPTKVDKIAAELDLHYFNTKPTLAGTLTDIFKLALLPTKEAPTPFWKYLAAAIVTIGSFVLGFLTFGRTAAKGVEALGRNPAAGKIIHLGIIFNVAIVVVIVLAGLTVSFLILRL